MNIYVYISIYSVRNGNEPRHSDAAGWWIQILKVLRKRSEDSMAMFH